MNRRINDRVLLTTLFNDLIGKDSQRGVTLTYSWLANQTGHFALGFLPSFFIWYATDSPLPALLIAGGIWTLFEVFNFLSPLLKRKNTADGAFPIQWSNIAFDTFTDVVFFWFGAFSVFFTVTTHSTINYVVLSGIVVYILIASRYWYLTKLYQQRAGYPFQFRLSQWSGKMNQSTIDELMSLIDNGSNRPNHYIITGLSGSGKSSLIVGLGNEISIRHRIVRYHSFYQWISQLSVHEKSSDRWSWKEAAWVLIDDINPGEPSLANKFGAADLKAYFSGLPESDRKKIATTSFLWVVGMFSEADTSENWTELLIEAGLEKEQIRFIVLS